MSTSTPVATYRSRRDGFAAEREREAGLSRRFSTARLGVFLAGVAALAVILFRAGRPPSWAVATAGGCLLCFLVLVRLHDRVIRRERRAAALVELQEAALARLGRRFAELPVPAPPPGAAETPLARDLDLFGRSSLFQLLGTAATPPGRHCLARWLLTGADPTEVRRRQAAVGELAPQLAWRQDLALAGSSLAGIEAGVEPFLRWAEGEPYLLARPWLLWLARGLTLASLALFALVVAGVVPWSLWALLAITNLVANYRAAQHSHAIFDRVEAGEAGFLAYAQALRLACGPAFAAPLLAELQRRLGRGTETAPAAMERLHRLVTLADARHSSLVHGLLTAFVLWDFHVLARLEAWQRSAGRQARTWLEALGEMEALAALAELAFQHPDWVMPSFVEAAPARLDAEALGHPLLANEARVANDVSVGPAGTFLLVTGSNMSGKSTLLRALGVNAVLAQAGGPVCARALALAPCRVATSILVEDSLASGVSFFLAELKRLKAIVDLARAEHAMPAGEGRAVLFLLDEVLRGTNSAERRIAVRRVVLHLASLGAFGAVTTHDLALAEETELAAIATPVHFRETVHAPGEGPAMTFDYRLRPGLATTVNALRLLALVGISDD